MNRSVAILIAISASSIVPAVLLATFAPLGESHEFSALAGSFIVALPFSIIANVALGLPAFLLLAKFEVVKWWTALLSAVILGILLAFFIRQPSEFDWHDLMTTVPLAVASAMTFYAVWSLAASHKN